MLVPCIVYQACYLFGKHGCRLVVSHIMQGIGLISIVVRKVMPNNANNHHPMCVRLVLEEQGACMICTG